jgi:hypothetical protein
MTILAHSAKLALAVAVGLMLGAAGAWAATAASSAEIATAKRLLAANGYADIAVLSTDDQLVTASAMRDGQRTVVDVDPMTGIILPHIAMPPLPAQLAPVTGLAANPS